MLHLHSSSLHHKSGQGCVTRDAEMVIKAKAAVETNPFIAATPYLINISTGQCADSTVQNHLTSVKELCMRALNESLSSDQKKTIIVLNAQHLLYKKQKNKKLSREVIYTWQALRNNSPSAHDTDHSQWWGTEHFIGNHECSEFPIPLSGRWQYENW